MIQIFSSYANDIITYQDNVVIAGGPAFWIQKTFADLGAEYRLHAWDNPGVVRISKDEQGEDRGYIVSVSDIPFLEFDALDPIIISTLKQEFNLLNLWNCENDIFIDIQWFLRSDNGKKNIFDCQQLQSRGHIYIKATREEYGYLTNTLQSHCTFIVTNGGNSVEIITKDSSSIVPIMSVDFTDTIGAWDTFLASLVYYFMRIHNLEKAASSASGYVFSFLKMKNNLL